MAPTPQELASQERELPPDGDEMNSASLNSRRIVISGMSGLYPRSRHIKQLSESLYNKVNLAVRPRWTYNNPEVPPYVGLLPDLKKFDAQFFKVNYHLCLSMDPMGRKILEQSYQAIYDAGVNPETLSGKKVGVYIATCLSETEKVTFYCVKNKHGHSIPGCNKAMFANRISYWLNVKGPSHAIDAACCSSTVALEQAYQAMTRGDCEAAIVGGANICLHPQTSFHYGRIINLCKDGLTKSYDQNADGCLRSEAINVLFLQKASDAFRIYADVLHVKNSFVSSGKSQTGQKFGFGRQLDDMTSFLNSFYDEAKISPTEVEYVEGAGAADQESDKVELEAFDKVFCKNRTEPLRVGSVTSNLGYSESASGIAGVTKVLLGYHTGDLAGNVYCTNPRSDVAGIREGRIEILLDNTPIKRTYIGVNGLSITGINSHVLLDGHYKAKDYTKYQCDLPRLVMLTGRQDSAVQNVINDLKSRPIDPEELALFQNIHSAKISGHLGRGYVILDTDKENKTISLSEKADYFDGGDRPLWFVYSGMGSQWAGMGAQLMRIPIFSAAIERCRKVLEPKGIDIVHIITSPDKTIYDNILHSFVGIAAVQIGLTDILHALGMVPDKIIGHSVGELGCAYADGCLTAEEMILSAYSRGLVSIQTPFIRGSMAAVGIGFEEVSKMCPPEIEVACHNGPDSSTISGPADIMTEFVAQLTAKGIFAKEVPCSNIAYHSRYIAEAGPGLLKYLTEVIKTPKLRSERWVSTSVPQDKWTEESAQYSSAEYHTNNLLSPVLFEETSRLVPPTAVLVEVAPHGLLQAILKRSMPASCAHVPLTRRGHSDNARFLLEAIGKIYMEGYYPDVRVLYPKVEFPVSTGTPHLSHLVEWAHDETWALPMYSEALKKIAAICTFIISVHDSENDYLQGHKIKGKMLYPFAGALVAVWDTLAMSLGALRKQVSVQFHEVHLFAQPALQDSRQLKLAVTLHRGAGFFEVMNHCSRVATGYIITEEKNISPKDVEETSNADASKVIKLTTEDVYQIFNARNYMYSGEFQSIKDTNEEFNEGHLQWDNNWVTFIDGILQLNTLRQPHDGISQPVYIRKLTINADVMAKITETETENPKLIKIDICPLHDYTKCGGILIESIRFQNIVNADENKFALKVPKYNQQFSDGIGLSGEVEREHHVNLQENQSSTSGIALKCGQVGDLESLQWVETSGVESANSGVQVKVHFAGLNAADAQKATGDIQFQNDSISGPCSFGMDFSGMTRNGDRVMGLVRGGALSDRVVAQPELLWPVPEHWSLEDAATVPLPYAHAYYCLAIKTRLLPGMCILISGGAGAIGQALISLALHIECRVFTTVSDMLKKRLLLKLFPQLKADHVICCRDDTFVDSILSATHGYGCEIVICGKGEYKNAYLTCSARHGVTLDIDHVKRNENFMFGMYHLTYERSYMRLDFSSIFDESNAGTLKELQSLITEGISRGAVRPLCRVTYAPNEAPRAFRLLAASRHRGRVLLRLQPTLPPPAQPTIVCSADNCQLVLGDDDGLTLQLADRLVKRGARTLHLRSTASSARLSLALKSWQKFNVKVKISFEDVSDTKKTLNLLNDSLAMGPLEGIFILIAHGLTDQKRHVFQSLVANLDAASRKLCPSLKYFAVINSDKSVGEEICLTRCKDRLPAMLLSVQTLTKVDVDGQSSTPNNYRELTNVIEQGLRSSQPVLFADNIPAKEMSPLLERLLETAGLKVPVEDIPETSTLQDLGMPIDNAYNVSIWLRITENIAIEKERVPFLTIQQIRVIEEMVRESDYSTKQGLDSILAYVDPDELLATLDMVSLPTLSLKEHQRDNEFIVNETLLCILPGIEGHHGRFRLMCERLKLPAVVLQPGLDNPSETIQETTEKYAKTYMKKFGAKKFYLLGYEMGVQMALGMASILEDNGLIGTVFCLGGGPDEFLAELEQQLRVATASEAGSDSSEDQVLQNAVVRHMCKLMGGGSSAQLEDALRDASSWREKVEASVRALRGRVAHSSQYARALIEAAYVRVTQARQHARAQAQVEPRALQSRVVLLRSPLPGAPAADPHPLARYSQLPLAVHDLRAPLMRSTDDLRVAAFINQNLDEDVLKEFENKNLCDTYVLNVRDIVIPVEFE